ncbi:thioesterase II family protein [Fibrella sp. WM1]|uniref:thioesterase II family protein n=1 Tax=Fibrella musci TaxID=3242485 RepID=UPI00351F8AFD
MTLSSTSEPTILFCIPFSGGSYYAYQSLLRHFPKSIQAVTLELPGRGRRFGKPLLHDAHAMTDDLISQMGDQLRPGQSYALFGHSLGALLAALVARKAQTLSLRQPDHLFVSGKGGLSQVPTSQRHRLPSAAFIREVSDFGGMSPELMANQALLNLFEPILRADIQASETYRYESQQITIPIDAFVGTRDLMTPDDVRLWQRETSHPLSLHIYEGNHFFLFDHEADIARQISTKLIRATQLIAYA